ncbi:MAG: glycosyltransferase family 4 protein [Planctomycetota bacterium]|nr:glycosyltransferase family 4 protein [Planctomycetota bacterium]
MAADTGLTIAHVDAETGFSGGEVQVFLLMEGLRRRGHRNLLVCPPGSRSEAEARARELETLAVPMRADLDLGSVLRIRSGLRSGGVDVVHLHSGRATWLGGLAARWAGLPAVSTRRMDRRVKRNWRTRLIYERLVMRAVAISPAVAECLRAGGVDPRRTRTIPSSVDPRALEPARGRADTRQELGVAEDEVLLLVLAALVRRKGIDVLLDALTRVHDARVLPGSGGILPGSGGILPGSGGILPGSGGIRLVVAGEGPERAALEEQASRAGLDGRVAFLGRREDKGDLLAACDVLVLPSRREGLGVAALEAMAAARAVVATRVGGLAEVVADGRTGLLVEPGDPDALAHALERVVGDPELRASLSAAGPERVAEGYLPEQMVSSYEELYRDVIAGGSDR